MRRIILALGASCALLTACGGSSKPLVLSATQRADVMYQYCGTLGLKPFLSEPYADYRNFFCGYPDSGLGTSGNAYGGLVYRVGSNGTVVTVGPQ